MATKKKTQTADQGTEPGGYAEAMAELEGLLRELDSNTIDVDVLSTKVQRASYLVEWCTERITAAQLTIDEMVAGFAEDEEFDDDSGDGDDF
ncbi:MAG: exodeoxyribonuclease VII small subunit [Ilumatobacteraceae bacterium]